jgi:hypothetical protein
MAGLSPLNSFVLLLPTSLECRPAHLETFLLTFLLDASVLV